MVGPEAAMVSAAISVTLKLLANKLAPLLMKGYSSVVDAKGDLLDLKSLAEEINCWLEKVGDKAVASETSFGWLKKLKDVSSDVDDLVDQFYLEAEKHDLSTVSKSLLTKLKAPVRQCKVALKIKAIKKRFAAVVKQRTDFSAITKSLTDGQPVQHTDKRTEEMPSLPNVDEKSVLGRNKEKGQIISKLLETSDQQKMKIVSIIGLGGSGKTTLAKLVFNEVNIIEKHFEVRLWVHVTQEFAVQKLIEKMFEAFSDSKSELHPLPYKVKRISEKLAGKRFLLVLDDVWTESQSHWEEFKGYVNCGTTGSRILLTTRSSKVAETVGSTDPFHLPFLSPDDSWRLFQQSLMPMKGWEGEFEEVGKEIVEKCGGIPLAIKVLAGVLRGKERIEEWHALRDNDNLLHVQGQEPSVSVSACLKLSYFHLPSDLKPCFTICAVFPKGNNIDKGQLIDLWIAHDLVAGVDSLLDYNGHKCFNSLVQMSFLQDVEESDGRVTCKMHDLVYDLARTILGDEISPVLPQEVASSTKSYRYFSVTEQPRNLQPKYNFEKARAVYVADGHDVVFGKSLKNAKHLRSITMNSVCKTVPATVLQIKHLRYLCILKLNCETLPEAISYIWSLQALHVPNSYLLKELPKSIGKLQRLRTLCLSGCPRLKSLPDSIGDCQMISTIDLYECRSITMLPDSIERNKKLRVLRLGYTKIERLPPGIATLEHLECLDLEGCNQLVALPDGIENLKKLHVLKLRSCTKLGSMPMGFGQLTQLRQLCLFVVGEGEKSAPISDLRNLAMISGNFEISKIAGVIEPEDAHKACLKDKTNLQTLKLGFRDQTCWRTDDRVIVEKDTCMLDGLEPPTEIKSLEIIGYAGRRYAQWMLNQDGFRVQRRPQFACLTRIELRCFPNLEHLQGLVGLPCLKELYLIELVSLKSISGGPFPSLVQLVLRELPSLGEVWIVTEKTLTDMEKIGDCSNNCSPRYFEQLRIGIHLSELVIEDCPELKVKPYLPPSLESLELVKSNEQLLLSPGQGQGSSLCSNDAYLPYSSSLNRLKRLVLRGITATSAPGSGSGCGWECLPCFRALEDLTIEECDGLTELPESMRGLRSLRDLDISGCDALCKLPDWLGELQSLQWIDITECHGLSSLPPSMQRLTTLRRLEIVGCSALVQLPEGLGELRSLQSLQIINLPSLNSFPQSLQHLTSLQRIWIIGCDALHLLPECLGDLRSLQRIWIYSLQGLTCLPQSMCRLTSLEELRIWRCPGLTSLPEWIQGLTALECLEISGCPDLQRRCEREKGEDWHLISHIPDLTMGSGSHRFFEWAGGARGVWGKKRRGPREKAAGGGGPRDGGAKMEEAACGSRSGGGERRPGRAGGARVEEADSYVLQRQQKKHKVC